MHSIKVYYAFMMYIFAPPRRSTPQGQLQKSSVPTYLTVNVLPH